MTDGWVVVEMFGMVCWLFPVEKDATRVVETGECLKGVTFLTVSDSVVARCVMVEGVGW